MKTIILPYKHMHLEQLTRVIGNLSYFIGKSANLPRERFALFLHQHRTIAYDFQTFGILQLSRMSLFLAQFNTRKILLAYKSHSTCAARLKNVMTMKINMHTKHPEPFMCFGSRTLRMPDGMFQSSMSCVKTSRVLTKYCQDSSPKAHISRNWKFWREEIIGSANTLSDARHTNI